MDFCLIATLNLDKDLCFESGVYMFLLTRLGVSVLFFTKRKIIICYDL